LPQVFRIVCGKRGKIVISNGIERKIDVNSYATKSIFVGTDVALATSAMEAAAPEQKQQRKRTLTVQPPQQITRRAAPAFICPNRLGPVK
jgi:hypothetical protein